MLRTSIVEISRFLSARGSLRGIAGRLRKQLCAVAWSCADAAGRRSDQQTTDAQQPLHTASLLYRSETFDPPNIGQRDLRK
jgi:hypothetical protein